MAEQKLQANAMLILSSLADGDVTATRSAKISSVAPATTSSLGVTTLYRLLKQLLDGGLVEESEHRPAPALDDERRRYYRITAAGRRALTAEIRRMERVLAAARPEARARDPARTSAWLSMDDRIASGGSPVAALACCAVRTAVAVQPAGLSAAVRRDDCRRDLRRDPGAVPRGAAATLRVGARALRMPGAVRVRSASRLLHPAFTGNRLGAARGADRLDDRVAPRSQPAGPVGDRCGDAGARDRRVDGDLQCDGRGVAAAAAVSGQRSTRQTGRADRDRRARWHVVSRAGDDREGVRPAWRPWPSSSRALRSLWSAIEPDRLAGATVHARSSTCFASHRRRAGSSLQVRSSVRPTKC